ncbi:MAG TPA: helix-turn-helix domain-containing protein [Chitinivibrionales bacterium]|nr:helix-turn-helix domain-containing protein [Chitinivibrionales bacterium]
MKEQSILPESEYLNARQLARKLNVSLKSIEKWTAQRRIPCVKIGYHWRYPVIEINKRLLSGQLVSPLEKAE